MRALLRALVIIALLAAGYFGLERLTVYPLDPRLIAPDDPRLSETRFDTMIVWTAPPRRGKPTVLYIHGNAGHLNNRIPRFQRLLDRGYGIVAPGLRGGSGSKGWPTEAAIKADIRALYAVLQDGALTGTPVAPIIYGESIGAAVTIHLVASHAMDHGWTRPKAIILEAPFTSLRDVAAHLHPSLPLATGLMLSQWRSIDYAPQIRAPLLILHGIEDDLIPLEMGEAILRAAGSQDKTLYPVEGAGHINVWTGAAQRRLYRFLSQF
ncbi:hypothetical protein C8N43_1313 [Litoreibacter ponti]|uniref:Serine aminopeptidase S33 domain-containing protein n=1 Tax=Litoreibacter ponti TaxID=1510457 RepID=A0A2T6BKR1_9RHOB|nr:alpha/beta hydrolase [Litoreibacter ponti]PTX56653.1 hypothetical protein C8N43_1313 [Litoreibacter ponti]